jgi:endonuclease/exonuclease/phosphatase family metal-dependent hydrolase
MFLRELKQVKKEVHGRWLVLGDFNLIYKVQDKNNSQLNRRLVNRFRRALNFMEVKKIELIGRKFTWTNIQMSPTLSRIDRVLCTPSWEEFHANPILQPLSSSISDHIPLLLVPLAPTYIRPIFRCETH